MYNIVCFRLQFIAIYKICHIKYFIWIVFCAYFLTNDSNYTLFKSKKNNTIIV